jgi:type I restriction enzyme, S subunit
VTWPQVKLNEAYWFQEGPGVRKWQFTTSGIKLLNVGNITKDRTIDLSKTDRHLSLEEVEKKYSHFLADEGDLVIASSGISIDYDGFLRTRGAFIRQEHLPLCMNTSTIRFKGTEGVSELGFLRHWLDSFEFRSQISREVTGIAQKNFGPSHLKRIKIALPPLEEQKRIAGILDAADILRAKRREALARLDDLLQSTFLDMFGDPVTNPKGWEEGLIGDLLESANYGTSKKADPNLGAYPVLRMNNITYSGEWNFTDLKYIDLEEKDLPKHLVHKGQILFNRTNSKELVGKTAVFRENEPMAFAGYLVRAIMNDRNDPEYLGAFMNTPQIKKYLQNKCNNIVGMANINAKKFQKIPIPLPPLDLQQRFAEIVSSVEEQKAKMRKHLEQLDDLFASLQQRAFRGDL